MTDSVENLTVTELAEIRKLQIAVGNQLVASKNAKKAPRELVGDVISDACDSVRTPRAAINEVMQKIPGPPFLLSRVMTVALTATMPLTATSETLFGLVQSCAERTLRDGRPH